MKAVALLYATFFSLFWEHQRLATGRNASWKILCADWSSFQVMVHFLCRQRVSGLTEDLRTLAGSEACKLHSTSWRNMILATQKCGKSNVYLHKILCLQIWCLFLETNASIEPQEQHALFMHRKSWMRCPRGLPWEPWKCWDHRFHAPLFQEWSKEWNMCGMLRWERCVSKNFFGVHNWLKKPFWPSLYGANFLTLFDWAQSWSRKLHVLVTFEFTGVHMLLKKYCWRLIGMWSLLD